LEVLCPRTGDRLAAWTFSGDDERVSRRKNARDEFADVGARVSAEVTCAAEILMTVPRRSAASHAAVALEDASFMSSATSQRHHVRRLVVAGLSTGLVCVVDVKSCRLVRAVRMPHRVTAVAVVANGSIGGADDDDAASPAVTHRNLTEELHFFQGVVAVGTQEGHLYLLVSLFFHKTFLKLVGFDLMSNSAGRDDATKPRRQSPFFTRNEAYSILDFNVFLERMKFQQYCIDIL
jgi:hypothetical protein